MLAFTLAKARDQPGAGFAQSRRRMGAEKDDEAEDRDCRLSSPLWVLSWKKQALHRGGRDRYPADEWPIMPPGLTK